MTRKRFDRTFLIVTLALGLGTTALAQEPPRIVSDRPRTDAAADELVCRVYSLTELGADAGLVAWAAETIPAVIEPGSWTQDGGRGVVRYYAPRRTLVVSHTAATHAKVKAFLAELQGGTTTGKTRSVSARPTSSVRRAGGVEPVPLSDELLPPSVSSYPVPPPQGRPKHLFHFLIRYEGEGIVDSSVVDLMRVQAGQQSQNAVQATSQSLLSGPKVPTSAPTTPSYTSVPPAATTLHPPMVMPVAPGTSYPPRPMPPAAD